MKKENEEKATKKNKEKEEMVGITGVGDDYSVYHMSSKEKTTAMLIGFILGFAMIYVFFTSVVFGIIFGVGMAVFAVPIMRKSLLNKRIDKMRLQFRDFLESLSSAYSSGQTALGGFTDARDDLKATHGDDADIVKELNIILKGIESNFRLDDLLTDFGKRVGIESVINFVDTYNVCYKRGGDVRKVVSETKQMINDQMEIEMEIQTGITESKNSINIIAIMPFIIITLLRVSGNDSIVSNDPMNVVVKLISLSIFIGSYLIGKKIMNIKF